MSDFQDYIKKFMRGDYESFDEIKVEDKKKNLSACILRFKEKLSSAMKAIEKAKSDSVVSLTEGLESLHTISNEVKGEKMKALLEGYQNTKTMLELDCDERDIINCKNALNIINESIDHVLSECGVDIDMDQPTVIEEVGINPNKTTADNPATEPMLESYENIVFMQGDEASEPLEILNDNGEEAAVEYLAQWHYPGEHETREDLGAGSQDTISEFEGDGGTYYLVYNKPIGYIGLSFQPTQEDIDDSMTEMENIGVDSEVDPAAVTAGSPEIEPEPLSEEPEHDAIPGIDKTTAGVAQQPVPAEDMVPEDPDMDPRDPKAQHEKPVEGEKATSAYEEGFQRGRNIWKMGENPKKIAQQLAETELSENPYGYVTRFQEGVVAGFSFQEEVEKDNNPDQFESLSEK